MYNSEKYIEDCLDSILAQNFHDYEVIVVDDFSTDNCCKIVEEYLQDFEGKLRIVYSKLNSGGAGTPRNTGIRLSRGEYILFLDSDDAITNTALEELYKVAQSDTAADVIHCERFYAVQNDVDITDKKFFNVASAEKINFAATPTVISENTVERIGQLAARKYWDSVNNNLFKRDFIVENNIKFADIPTGENSCFTTKVLCLAKKIIRVPNIFYIYRQSPKGITRSPMNEQKFSDVCQSVFRGIEYQDDFLREFEAFRSQKDVLYALFDKFISEQIPAVLSVYPQNPAPNLDSLIRHELYKVDDPTTLTAFLFSRMNVFNLNLIQQQQHIQKLQEQIKKLQTNQPQPVQVQKPKPQFVAHNNEEDIFKM